MKTKAKTSSSWIRLAVILGLALLVSVIFLRVFITAKGKEPENPGYKYYTSIQIKTGDSLWSIASRYCSDPEQIPAYVKELRSMNHLETDEIHAGNYLTVMYYSEEYK